MSFIWQTSTNRKTANESPFLLLDIYLHLLLFFFSFNRSSFDIWSLISCLIHYYFETRLCLSILSLVYCWSLWQWLMVEQKFVPVTVSSDHLKIVIQHVRLTMINVQQAKNAAFVLKNPVVFNVSYPKTMNPRRASARHLHPVAQMPIGIFVMDICAISTMIAQVYKNAVWIYAVLQSVLFQNNHLHRKAKFVDYVWVCSSGMLFSSHKVYLHCTCEWKKCFVKRFSLPLSKQIHLCILKSIHSIQEDKSRSIWEKYIIFILCKTTTTTTIRYRRIWKFS